MAKKTIRMTLDVEIEDLSAADREQAAKDMGCPVEEVPDISEIAPEALAELIGESLPGNEELFGGSMMYCTITKARGFNAGEQE